MKFEVAANCRLCSEAHVCLRYCLQEALLATETTPALDTDPLFVVLLKLELLGYMLE